MSDFPRNLVQILQGILLGEHSISWLRFDFFLFCEVSIDTVLKLLRSHSFSRIFSEHGQLDYHHFESLRSDLHKLSMIFIFEVFFFRIITFYLQGWFIIRCTQAWWAVRETVASLLEDLVFGWKRWRVQEPGRGRGKQQNTGAMNGTQKIGDGLFPYHPSNMVTVV